MVKEKAHSHEWMITKTVPYRSESRKHYMCDIYRCECGAGKEYFTPTQLFDKGFRITDESNKGFIKFTEAQL